METFDASCCYANKNNGITDYMKCSFNGVALHNGQSQCLCKRLMLTYSIRTGRLLSRRYNLTCDFDRPKEKVFQAADLLMSRLQTRQLDGDKETLTIASEPAAHCG